MPVCCPRHLFKQPAVPVDLEGSIGSDGKTHAPQLFPVSKDLSQERLRFPFQSSRRYWGASRASLARLLKGCMCEGETSWCVATVRIVMTARERSRPASVFLPHWIPLSASDKSGWGEEQKREQKYTRTPCPDDEASQPNPKRALKRGTNHKAQSGDE